MYVIRKRLKLPSEQGIYLFVNGVIPPSSAMLNAVYEEHKDQGMYSEKYSISISSVFLTDGFLYMTYSGENTFGSL